MMSNQKKSWNNVSKKRRPYKKNRYNKGENSSDKWRGSNNGSWKGSSRSPVDSKHDFPSLTENKFSTFNRPTCATNTYNALAWRKNSDSSSDTNTIYTKAKNGATKFNSYPLFSNSPEFPLFQ